jgi:hypothetical protein
MPDQEHKDGRPFIEGVIVIDSMWITLPCGRQFGAILIDNGYERKIYCGLGDGDSQESDTRRIIRHGGKMHPEGWAPFLTQVWNERSDRFCPKCGMELPGPLPVSCQGCGTYIEGVKSNTHQEFHDGRHR